MELDISRLKTAVIEILRGFWGINATKDNLDGWPIEPGYNSYLIAAVYATKDSADLPISERFTPGILRTVYVSIESQHEGEPTPEQRQELLLNLTRYIRALRR